MKPLISYYGGKQRIASKIVAELNKIPHTVYVEPFFGGGAVFFAREKPVVTNSDHYREVINDSSKELINLYRVARDQPEAFYRTLELTPYSREDHRLSKQILKNPGDYSDLDRAWAYYVDINQSFANKLLSGWGTGVVSRNLCDTWNNRINRLPECLARLKETHIECDDALSVIRRWDSPQTLMYLDPPYPGTNLGHYDGYTIEDWKNLCDLLDESQCSYVLSNYQQDIQPLSADRVVGAKTHCSSSGKGKVGKGREKTRKAIGEELGDRSREEVLWMCDRSHAMRDELKKVVAKRTQPQPVEQSELSLG